MLKMLKRVFSAWWRGTFCTVLRRTLIEFQSRPSLSLATSTLPTTSFDDDDDRSWRWSKRGFQRSACVKLSSSFKGRWCPSQHDQPLIIAMDIVPNTIVIIRVMEYYKTRTIIMPVIPGCQHRGMEYCSGELMRGFTAWSFVQHCRWEEFFVLINNPALLFHHLFLN